MKNINLLPFTTFIILLIINMSCSTDNEGVLDSQNLTLETTNIDSVKIIIKEEKKDSLPPKKYIYLTIDDSPLNGSIYIDSVILSHKIKTNLFMVGNSVDGSSRFRRYYEMFKENPYVEIYNHSYSHANNRYTNFYKDAHAVLSDFEKNQINFNISYKIARLPGRNLWQIGEKKKNYNQTGATSADMLVKNGYKIYGWDIEWTYNFKDYNPQKTIDELITEIETSYHSSKTFTPKHIVLLIHDQMFVKINEKNNLGELITKLKEQGFTFEYLSSYPE